MFDAEMIEAEEERMKERNAHIEAKREHPENKKKQESAQKEKKEETCLKAHLQLYGQRNLSRASKRSTCMQPPLKIKDH